jgi:homoserine kinase
MRARVPASSANLGPGFDALAVALSLYIEVTVTDAPAFAITTSGFGAGQFDSSQHLGAVVAAEVRGDWNFALHVHSDIPLSRGLGSSASLALAAAAAAGSPDPLAYAARVDGHAENAAASLLGGLVTAAMIDGVPVARSLPLDGEWTFVVVIPDEELATAKARAVLPASVPFHDAVHNVTAMGLLIAGLANRSAFVPAAMDDCLHQPYRMDLLPYARQLLATLRDAGAAGSCWSGAGSTMLALVDSSAVPRVVSAGEAFLAEQGIPGRVLHVDADHTGLVLGND